MIPNLLFLSNLTRSKGVFEFIDALKILKDQKHKFNARIVGPEYDITITELEQYVADKELQNQVKIEGPVYGDAKFRHFLESDVFVFPTWFEAFPGVVLEAMQAGVPVVSTHEGAIPEIVEEGVTGYLVPQKDVGTLAGRLGHLLKNRPLRNRMGQAARQKFLDEFTSSIFEKKMNEVFVKAMMN
jgi:glycosyltransferase involved in cell wall biosynthesis